VEYSISTTGFGRPPTAGVEKLVYTRVDKSLKPVPGSEGRAAGRPGAVRQWASRGPVEGDVIKELALPVVTRRGRFQGPRRQ